MALIRSAGAPGLGDARRQSERMANTRGFEGLARAGLVARGVVYAIIGVLALKLALGDGGKATNQQGALRTIAHGSFGTTLLIVMAIGLAGYALWRLTRAALGHGAEQHDDTMDRVSALASGIAYAVLCVAAVKIVTGAHAGSGTPKKATGGVLDWTGGPVLVALAGAILIGVAGYQAYKGLAKKFLEDSKTGEMSRSVKRAFTALGVFGHVARAVVFALMGYGMIRAAIEYDPQKAVGLDGALRNLANASYGPWLLGLVAAGLVGFAAYSIADARYRKV
ncbi:DUF1206 domain-containing protein [Baekduia soli]|uniref:DUF1206 domain-containing protein n=1 Tax=Baekduia soli TaxID=496014 RepID=A0A5B8U0G8_9ACTN|nr:DUF1206 domain-containing protein [Baekduia soli]QEC46509.1 DUF1206 domain-containing protein [Baekduia soli]